MNKYSNHLVIIGSARSGTSWLSELFARQFRYRMLFEPEHEFLTKNGKLICDQYIKDFKNHSPAKNYLKRVFKNRVDCDWIAQNSNRKYKMHLWPYIPKKYIIKFVRANLSGKSINETFNIPLIHLIRNPYDVIQSQRRVHFPWLYDLSIFQNQEDLVSLLLDNYKLDITNINNLSEIEILTIRWCIENVIPLEVNKPYKNKSRIIRFEDLKNNPNQFLELCSYFNLEPVSNLHEEFKKPSSKTHPKSKIINKYSTDRGFSKNEYQLMNCIFDKFNTKIYPRNSK